MKTVILVLAFLFLCSTASFAATKNCEYWPDGKVRICTISDSDGNVLEDSYYREDSSLEEHVKFDVNGHKIEESHFNSNGKLKETADGWAAIKWEYSGRTMTQEGYYGADGKIKERKIYNDNGDLVHKQYYGISGIDPDEEYSPDVPLLSHETVSYYGSYGEPEGETTVYRY